MHPSLTTIWKPNLKGILGMHNDNNNDNVTCQRYRFRFNVSVIGLTTRHSAYYQGNVEYPFFLLPNQITPCTLKEASDGISVRKNYKCQEQYPQLKKCHTTHNMKYTFFYKKLGSAPSTKTKSFLISHENFAIIVIKVSYLVSYFPKLNCLIFWMLSISGWR